MRQILFFALLLLIVDVLSLDKKRETNQNEEETAAKQPIKYGGDKVGAVGKTGSLGNRGDEGEGRQSPPQEKKPLGRGAGLLGQTGKTDIEGRPRSQPDGDTEESKDKNSQSVPDSTKNDRKKTKSGKGVKGPLEKGSNPGGDEEKDKGKTLRSNVDSGEPQKPPRKEVKAEPNVETSNDGEAAPNKRNLPSEKDRKPTGDDSKPNSVKSDNQNVADNEGDDENDDDNRGVEKQGSAVSPKVDKQEIEWNDNDDDEEEKENEIRPMMENALAQQSVKTIGKVGRPTETSSSGSFVTYFIIAVVVVIVIYLVFHNKKKLMAYVIEGRNTGRVRRSRGTSGAEYKPLNNPEELTTGCRTESA